MGAAAMMTGSLDTGQVIETRAPHRDGNPTPVARTVTMTVPLSHDDIEAVLWPMVMDGVALDELDDPETATLYLFDALLGFGTSRTEQTRRAIASLTPGSEEHGIHVELRARVEQLYGPRPSTVPAPRPILRGQDRALSIAGARS